MLKYFFLALLFVRSAFAQEYWIEADYLLWFIKDSPLPTPLVTTASFDDPLPGAIGQPHTHTVLGKKSIDMGWMQGFQIGAGWIGCNVGIEGSYFLLPTISKSESLITSGNPGSPNYAVPIFDFSGVFGLNGVPGETIFLLPGPFSDGPGFSGAFTLHLTSLLQGAELEGLYRIWGEPCFEFDLSGGFTWVNLHEKLRFQVVTLALPEADIGSAFYNTTDRFETRNHFLAGHLKITARYQMCRWFVEGFCKGALGATLEQIKIQGSGETSEGNLFFLTQGTENTLLPGGIFAEPSNRGSHKKSPFAWSFEAMLKTGFEITKNMEMHIGYTFLWISKVVRPGEQMDRHINSTRTALADASRATVGIGPGPVPFGDVSLPAPLPSGPNQPKVVFHSSTFWAQGLEAGIKFQF